MLPLLTCVSLTGMAELVGLVQRLEVAVGRLEAISNAGGAGGSAVAGGGTTNETLVPYC